MGKKFILDKSDGIQFDGRVLYRVVGYDGDEMIIFESVEFGGERILNTEEKIRSYIAGNKCAKRR